MSRSIHPYHDAVVVPSKSPSLSWLTRTGAWLGAALIIFSSGPIGQPDPRVAATLALATSFTPAAATAPVGSTAGTFSVTAGGDASYEIPLIVPPGINGVTPNLSLAYNSRQSNGVLGMGWALNGLSAVTRCPQTQAQDGPGFVPGVHLASTDRFCVDGQRLMVTSGAYGADGATYRTERESGARITSHGSCGSGPCSLTIEAKNGSVLEMGTTEDSRIEATGKSTVRVWALAKITDRNGNDISVDYTENPSSGEYYASQVRYTGHATTGLVPQRLITLTYENRSDVSTEYLVGSVVKQTQRLATLTTYVDVDGDGNDVATAANLTKTYTFSYAYGTATGRTHLTSVQECGSDGVCLPPTTFDWQGSTTNPIFEGGSGNDYRATGICADGAPNPEQCASRNDYSTISYPDVNGDGLADLAYRGSGGIQVWLSTLGSPFSQHVGTDICSDGSASYGVCNDDDNYDTIQYPDFNGDGRADLAYRGDEGIQVWLSTASAPFSQRISSTICANGSKDYGVCNDGDNYATIQYPDINNDGQLDLAYRGDEGIQVWLNVAAGFTQRYASDICANDPKASDGQCDGNNNSSLKTIGYHDVSGNGMTELVYRGNDGMQVWRWTANGFTSRVASDVCSNSAIGYKKCDSDQDYATLQYPDVNGDGRADLAYRSSDGGNGVQVWLGGDNGFNGGHAWTDICSNDTPQDYGVCNDANNYRTITYPDLNGDGLADLAYRGDQGMQTRLSNGVASAVGGTFVDPVSSDICADGASGSKQCDADNDYQTLAYPDVNGDGRADLAYRSSGGGGDGVQIWLSTPQGFTRQLSSSVCANGSDSYGVCNDNNNYRTIRYADIGGKGRPSLLYRADDGGVTVMPLIRTDKNSLDLVTTLTNGIGGSATVEYASLVDDSVYTKGSGAVYPEIDFIGPMYVVAHHVDADGRGNSYAFDYTYAQARGDVAGRGWLGFRTFTTTDLQKGVANVATHSQEFPLLGMVEGHELRFVEAGTLLGRIDSVYQAQNTTVGNTTIATVYKVTDEFTQFSPEDPGETPQYTWRKTYSYDDGKQKMVAAADLGEVCNEETDPECDRKDYSADNLYLCVEYATPESDAAWWQGFSPIARKTTSTEGGCSNPDFDLWNPTVDLRFERFGYDERMNLTTSEIWDDHKNKWLLESSTYDPYGNPISATDPLGNRATFDYDTTYHTFPTTEVSPPPEANQAPLTVTTSYEPRFGQLTQLIDANGNVLLNVPESGLDGFGRVVEVESGAPDQPQLVTLAKAAYLPAASGGGMSLKTWQRQAWGAAGDWNPSDPDAWLWSQDDVDGIGRTYQTVGKGLDSATDVLETQIFDAAGRLWKTSLPYYSGDDPRYVEYQYDSYGRPIREISPNGALRELAYSYVAEGEVNYDDRQFLFHVPDPSYSGQESRQVTMQRLANVHAQLTTTVDPDGNTATYEYDRLGQLVKMTDTLGETTTYVYDSAGQLLSESNPETGTTTYAYDDVGSVVEIVDAEGQKADFAYDALERTTRKTVYDTAGQPETTITYTYDQAVNGKGLLSRIDLAGSTPLVTTYGYNRINQVVSERLELDMNGVTQTFSTESRSDPLGRPTTLTYPDSSVARYLYQADGNLSAVELQGPGESTFRELARYEGYTALGQYQAVSYGNGVTSELSYDLIGRPLTSRTAKGALTFRDMSYTWNKADKMVAMNDERTDPAENLSALFAYNQVGQLIYTEGPSGHFSYAYDAAGNMTERNNLIFQYDAAKKHQLIGGCQVVLEAEAAATSSIPCLADTDFSAAYDDSGNLVEKDVLEIYPAANEDVELSGVIRGGHYNTRGSVYFVDGAQVEPGSEPLNIGAETAIGLENEVAVHADSEMRVYNARLDNIEPTQRRWHYTYDAEGQLTLVEQESPDSGERTFVSRASYDQDGNRLSKVDATGTTWYVTSTYEVYDPPTGTPVYTKYVFGPQGVVAAISTSASQTLAWQETQNSRTLAALSDTGTALGSVVAAAARAQAFVGDPRFAARGPGVLLATGLLGLCLILFLLTSLSSPALARRSGRSGRVPKSWQSAHPLRALLIPILIPALILVHGGTAHATLTGDGTPQAGSTLYLHQDHLGSTTLVTDGTGAEVSQVVYEPYGTIDDEASSGENSFRPKFTGKEHDTESRLDYFGARYYDNQIGRFLTPDPAQQYFSPYIYVGSDPINNVDPDGGVALAAVLTGISIAVGAVLTAYSAAATVNGTWNPADWDWTSGKTWSALILGGIIGGVAGGASAAAVSSTAGIEAIIATEALIAGLESVAFTLLIEIPLTDEELGFGDLVGSFASGAIQGAVSAGVSEGITRGISQARKHRGSSKPGGARGGDVAGAGTAGTYRQTGGDGGGDACSASFPASTTVLTPDGPKSIEEIQVGDEVWSYDEQTETARTQPVSRLFSRSATQLIALTLEDTTLEATNEHLFFVPERGWIQAQDLRVGDQVLRQDGQMARVQAVESRSLSTRVFNFTVEDTHSYFVGSAGVLAHNQQCSNRFKKVHGANNKKAAKKQAQQRVNRGERIGVDKNRRLFNTAVDTRDLSHGANNVINPAKPTDADGNPAYHHQTKNDARGFHTKFDNRGRAKRPRRFEGKVLFNNQDGKIYHFETVLKDG